MKLLITSEHSFIDVSLDDFKNFNDIHFLNKADAKCLELKINQGNGLLYVNYYIGVDWLQKNESFIYVTPKLNEETKETDYFKMLFSCMKHPEIAKYSQNLCEIKFDEPYIKINQQQDLITPLLMIRYLQVLKSIVKKGLKKSYYRVEENLSCKIKGRVAVSKTLKQNLLRNRLNKTICNFEVFGTDCIENKVLKYALKFIEAYLLKYKQFSENFSPLINFCKPAFNEVNESSIDFNLVKQKKINAFFQEYKEALDLAEMIIKRFSYNLREIEQTIVSVPPFWIDMPKLFELYVLGLMKDRYGSKIQFQAKGNYGEPDFLLNSENEKIIIDTKYKCIYQGNNSNKSRFNSDDIRQMCGYARDKKILNKLGYDATELQKVVVDCLIIYPDQNASEELPSSIKQSEIKQFIQFYKMPIKLPTLGE